MSDDLDKSPERLTPIGLEDLKRFSVDRDTNELYYNNKKIHLGGVVSLERWQFRTGVLFGCVGVLFGLFGVVYNIVYIANTAYHWNGFGPVPEPTPIVVRPKPALARQTNGAHAKPHIKHASTSLHAHFHRVALMTKHNHHPRVEVRKHGRLHHAIHSRPKFRV